MTIAIPNEAVVTGPGHGAGTLATSTGVFTFTYTFTYAAGFAGTDSFTFDAKASGGTSNAATDTVSGGAR